MPAAKKSPAKASARPRAAATVLAHIERDDRAIGRLLKTLDAAQKDLAAIGGSLGTGASDVRKDVARLLRDARRDVTKMSKAVQRELERLQRDLRPASKPKKPSPARAGRSKARSGTAARTRRKSA
jgi:hypothetical protein